MKCPECGHTFHVDGSAAYVRRDARPSEWPADLRVSEFPA